MQRFAKSAFIGLCISVFFLILSSSAARAQVLAHSGDVAGYGGYQTGNYNSQGLSPGDTHPFFGISGGYNIVPAITVFGEYNYLPMGSSGPNGVESAKTQEFGGGARFNFMTSRKVVPYAVAAFGGNRYTLSETGEGSASFNGYYMGFGGGANIFIGHNWGVRPEFRYVRQEVLNTPVGNIGANTMMESGGVFFQFGGQGTTKK